MDTDANQRGFLGFNAALLIVFFLIGIPLTIWYIKIGTSPFANDQKPTTKLLQETTAETIRQKNHPLLYVAVLQYNPALAIAVKLSEAIVNGDEPHLLPAPSKNPNDFSYKVEVLSSTNTILQQGFKSIPLEIVQKDGSISFRVIVHNLPKSILNVSLPNGTRIWKGEIPKL